MTDDETPVGPPDETDDETPVEAHDGAPADPLHDRAREGIEHLQSAARELIAAARAALDVAEDLVDDPDTVASLAGMADTVTGFVRSVVPSRRTATTASRTGGDQGDQGSSGVRRIPVT